MDFLIHNWWLVLALILWIMRVNKEQKKRVARRKAEQESKTEKITIEQFLSTPAENPISPSINPEEQNEPFFLDKDYAFNSPVEAEEKQDERARAEAFKFKPVENDADAPEEKVNGYAFKTEGAFPAFEPPREEVTAGDYFPQGIQSRLSQSFISADDLRRSIITMEILLPPRCKRPRR